MKSLAPQRKSSKCNQLYAPYAYFVPWLMGYRSTLDDTSLTLRQRRVCLLMLRYGKQTPVAAALGVEQSTVSRHLHASVRKYPALKPLLVMPRGRRRIQQFAA